MLPDRSEFAMVWRYLTANVQGRVLQEDLGCLSRKITRCAGTPCAPGRLQICLDVFRERGLLSFETNHGRIQILLAQPAGKVDLEQSPIIMKLKQQKAGEFVHKRMFKGELLYKDISPNNSCNFHDKYNQNTKPKPVRNVYCR